MVKFEKLFAVPVKGVLDSIFVIKLKPVLRANLCQDIKGIAAFGAAKVFTHGLLELVGNVAVVHQVLDASPVCFHPQDFTFHHRFVVRAVDDMALNVGCFLFDQVVLPHKHSAKITLNLNDAN
jgi:hypothetical protein